MDDKYPFITYNRDKNISNKSTPTTMYSEKCPITYNLDNRERDSSRIPDNKEVEEDLEKEAALQQVQMTLNRVRKQLDNIKHPSHECVAVAGAAAGGGGGGLSPSWGYGSEPGAAAGGGLSPSWGYGYEPGAAAGGILGPFSKQSLARLYPRAPGLTTEQIRHMGLSDMAACKKHDRPKDGKKGGSGIIDMFKSVRGCSSSSSKRKASSSRRIRKTNHKSNRRGRGRGRGRSSRRLRR